MYQSGDYVVYGIHGVCRVLQQEQQNVDRRQVTYLVLEPLEQAGARFLVPAHNQAALAKLRPVLSYEELDALLHSREVRENAWIADENRRKQHYRELINSGDRMALLRMVRTLHLQKSAQAAAGRKFHMCDDNFLRDAERLLNSEFSLILGIEPNEVSSYVLSALNEG